MAVSDSRTSNLNHSNEKQKQLYDYLYSSTKHGKNLSHKTDDTTKDVKDRLP